VSAPGGIILAFDPQIQLYTPLVQGFFQGAVYGLIGLGIVLLYKSNGIFNFAQAEFGTVAALVTYAGLNGSFFGLHMPYGVACLVGIMAGTLSAVLTERLVVRPLFNRPRVILLVGTVGVLLLMVAIEGLMFQELRNPQTGATISLPAGRKLSFRPSLSLRKLIKGPSDGMPRA